MVNFILITLITKLLISLITKANPLKSNVLQCGIFGFYGESSKNLDWNKFNILGIFNDARGGDASGIVYGDNYSHQNKSQKLFVNHISDLKFPDIEDAHWAFGHTRKASFGKNQHIHYTQPLLKFENKEITNVFCHNGTLYNHEELIEEYQLDNSFLYPEDEGNFSAHKLNDSWTLHYALINRNFDILTKYHGGTAFSYYEKRLDKLYLWSGASKNTEYSNVITEERPLYISEYNDHIWFSSEKQPLDIIDIEDKARTFKVSPNTLYIYSKGKLIDKEINFNRDNCTQTNYANSPSNYDYYGYNSRDYKPSLRKQNRSIKASKTLSLPMPAFGTNLIDKEEFKSDISDVSAKFIRGRYWYKGKLLSGIKHINLFGEIYDSPVVKGKKHEVTDKFYFYEGILINDHNDYNELCRNMPKKRYSGAYSDDVKEVSKYSIYPVTVFGKEECWYYTNGNVIEFTGNFRPVFSKMNYTFYKGEILEIKDLGLGIAFMDDGFDIEIDEVIEEADYSDVDARNLTKCEACEGTCISPTGNNCSPCKGSGWVQNVESNEIEDHIRNNDLPFDDSFADDQKAMVNKEICEELGGVLQSVESAKCIIQYHQGATDKADEVIQMLDKMSSDLELAGMPF